MGRRQDIINQRFGKLIVIREFSVPYEGKMKNRKTFKRVECKCDCGNTISPFKSNVLGGHTRGCSHCQRASNYTGKRIGKIEILERFWKYDNAKHHRVYYKIKCDCGHIFEMSSNTTRRLKGIRCKKCPNKPKPLLSRPEAISFTNYKKHLKSRDRKIGQKSGYLKLVKFFGWFNTKKRRYSLYEMKCKCGNKIIRRGDVVGRVFSCGCLRIENMARGEKCSNSQLKDKDVYMIRELLKTGTYTQRQIAKMFNVSEQTISHIKLNKAYMI
jgi:predicted XRE-type DNA-binding protein